MCSNSYAGSPRIFGVMFDRDRSLFSVGEGILRMPEGQFFEHDVRSIVRLLGDIAICSDDLDDRRGRLLEGLAEIIGCEVWAWDFMPIAHPNGLPPSAQLARSFPPSLIEKIRAPQRSSGVITLGNSGRSLLYVSPEQDGHLPVIAMGRGAGKPELGERELMIVRVVIGETPWFHRRDSETVEEPTAPLLAPRLRPVLTKLLEGYTAKQMSNQLSLSEHSVRTYTRAIYKALGVNTRAELQHRFMTGQIADDR